MFDNFSIDSTIVARRRRRHFFLFGAALGLLVGVTVSLRLQTGKLTEVSAAFRAISEASEKLIAGGDVVIDPPIIEVLPPRLPMRIGTTTPPDIAVQGLMVKDHETGAVLFGKNEYIPRAIASITKLMTALVLLEKGELPLSATTTVPTDDIVDTHMYARDTYTMDDLWHAMLVASSNKAALALVDAVWGSRTAFVERMNQKALELGMADSVFADATGLSDGNTSSASDVAMLLREAMDEPVILSAMTTQEYELYSKERNKKHHFWNTNWLLLGWIPHSFQEVRGGKTGYIPESGYNVAVEVVDGAGHALDVVVFGAENNEARFVGARDIAEWVFANFRWPSNTPQLNP